MHAGTHRACARHWFWRRHGTWYNRDLHRRGEVAEWSIAPASKAGVPLRVPGVRISPSPPFPKSPNPAAAVITTSRPAEAAAKSGQRVGGVRLDVAGDLLLLGPRGSGIAVEEVPITKVCNSPQIRAFPGAGGSIEQASHSGGRGFARNGSAIRSRSDSKDFVPLQDLRRRAITGLDSS